MRDRRRRADERGASLVEFAFVLPVMVAFLMGLITYGLIEAGDNTGSSAAREGARVGIIRYENAHLPGTPANDEIVAAVDRHMGNGFVTDPDVAVRCVRPAADGTISPIDPGGSCAPDVVVRGRDLLEVSVEWDPIGPVEQPRRSELARMTIVGRPQLSETSTSTPVDNNPNDDVPPEYQVPPGEELPPPPPPPADCVITAVTVDPNPVRVNGNKLFVEVIYRAETNGGLNCGEVVFHWGPNTHDAITTASKSMPADNAYIGALPKNSGSWTVGINKTVKAVASNGASSTLQFEAVAHNNK